MNGSLYTASFADGELIFGEGDTGDCAYIIEHGAVEIWSHKEGKRLQLALLSPGAIFGEMSVIDDVVRSANATAHSATRLTVVTSSQLRMRLEDSDPVVRLIVEVLLRRYRNERRMHRGDDAEPELEPPSPLTAGDDNTPTAIEKIKLEATLKQALEEDALSLTYQPIVELSRKRIAGMEALIRWNHPTRGYISPQEFIDLAEETRLILPIDRWVLNRACRDLAVLQQLDQRGGEPLFVNVNLSGREVMNNDILVALDETVELHGLHPQNVKVEVTEGVLVDSERAFDWIQRCQARGFRVVLDDFGTGYSSLAYLRNLPLDTLKIDKAFVGSICNDASSKAIVNAIIQMARALGMAVVAEGVETLEVCEALTAMGCDYGQGYYFARPLTPADVAERLNKDAA
ncbi:MAG: EAL domain-containing protein [Myxococcota bacterium]|jgi:EAL domain-containing protein (putative c-di-GMP-specific phosphodiesterase class I)|nr:EAL domain-containing protein [Myxococcota bacterium]